MNTYVPFQLFKHIQLFKYIHVSFSDLAVPWFSAPKIEKAHITFLTDPMGPLGLRLNVASLKCGLHIITINLNSIHFLHFS